MTTIELPIGATADTLIRRICEQLPDIDTRIFASVVRNAQGADVIGILIRERPDVKPEWQ